MKVVVIQYLVFPAAAVAGFLLSPTLPRLRREKGAAGFTAFILRREEK